jgi:hypothetical protein
MNKENHEKTYQEIQIVGEAYRKHEVKVSCNNRIACTSAGFYTSVTHSLMQCVKLKVKIKLFL